MTEPMIQPMTRKILICLHDVTPRHADRVKEFDGLFRRYGVETRYSMLIVPDFWGSWPLDADADFCDWLRGRAESGVEMILHGYYHKDTAAHAAHGARLKAKYMTAGEGEFLGLDRAEAERRILAGQAMLERVLGQPSEGFVAPAWLYGEGARNALSSLGFRFAEDHWRVWRPDAGNAVAARGPVISYASRSKARIASSLLWSNLARPLLHGTEIVRLALHPHDLGVAALRREIEKTLAWFTARRQAVLYRDLAADAASRSAA